MDSSRQQQFIRSSLCWLLALIWGFAVINILLPATLPFWLGLAVAFLLKPITLWLSRRLRFHRKGAAFAVMLLFYLLLIEHDLPPYLLIISLNLSLSFSACLKSLLKVSIL